MAQRLDRLRGDPASTDNAERDDRDREEQRGHGPKERDAPEYARLRSEVSARRAARSGAGVSRRATTTRFFGSKEPASIAEAIEAPATVEDLGCASVQERRLTVLAGRTS